MDIDFPLILTLAVLVTGLVSLADKLYFAQRRAVSVEGLEQEGASAEVIELAQKEPWLIENSKGFFSGISTGIGVAFISCGAFSNSFRIHGAWLNQGRFYSCK